VIPAIFNPHWWDGARSAAPVKKLNKGESYMQEQAIMGFLRKMTIAGVLPLIYRSFTPYL
jgi:hypothetical protein